MKSFWWGAWLVAAVLASAMMGTTMTAAADDCGRGKALYEEAVLLSDLDRRIALLEKSMAACRTFRAAFELGRTYEAAGRLADAESALRDARVLAGTDHARALAFGRLGVVCEKRGRTDLAETFLKRSMAHERLDGVTRQFKGLLRRRADRGMTAAEIKGALLTGRGVDVEPAVDIHVRFAYNSHDLTEEGRQQAEALGEALSDPVFADNRFHLVGHTDQVGSQEYNLPLSQKRAETVRQYILEHFDIAPDRIRTSGQGKAELLFHDDDKATQALNRRVEVRFD